MFAVRLEKQIICIINSVKWQKIFLGTWTSVFTSKNNTFNDLNELKIFIGDY